MASSRSFRFSVTICSHCGVSEVAMLDVDAVLEERPTTTHAHINGARVSNASERHQHGIDSGACKRSGS
jgi:hypothetical protein